MKESLHHLLRTFTGEHHEPAVRAKAFIDLVSGLSDMVGEVRYSINPAAAIYSGPGPEDPLHDRVFGLETTIENWFANDPESAS